MALNFEGHYREDTYRTRICHWCRRHLSDGEKIYSPFNDKVYLCENCKGYLIAPPDYDPKGSMLKGTTSWVTARILALIRDDCRCRICGADWKRDNPIEVHHIIPKKDGGTHHLANLITLCDRHHKETFRNGYAGLELTDRFVQIGTQKRLVESRGGG